jgi:hypothetical protein
MTNGDIYWIRPVKLTDTEITVLERVLGDFNEGQPDVGWAVNTYDVLTGQFIQTLAEVHEPVDTPQYLADNPDVQFDGFGNFMVFADKGPDWGTGADFIPPPHDGFEHEVLYYHAETATLVSVLAPRSDADGHGQMDSLAARSTGGSFDGRTWAMASTSTDLYDSTGNYYASDLWSGIVGFYGGDAWMDLSFSQWTSKAYLAGTGFVPPQPYPEIAPGTVDPVEAGWYQIRWALDLSTAGWPVTRFIGAPGDPPPPDPFAGMSMRFEHEAMVGRTVTTGIVVDRAYPGKVTHPLSPDRHNVFATFTTTVFHTPGAGMPGSFPMNPHVYFPYTPDIDIELARLRGEVTHFRAAPYDEIVPA